MRLQEGRLEVGGEKHHRPLSEKAAFLGTRRQRARRIAQRRRPPARRRHPQHLASARLIAVYRSHDPQSTLSRTLALATYFLYPDEVKKMVYDSIVAFHRAPPPAPLSTAKPALRLSKNPHIPPGTSPRGWLVFAVRAGFGRIITRLG